MGINDELPHNNLILRLLDPFDKIKFETLSEPTPITEEWENIQGITPFYQIVNDPTLDHCEGWLMIFEIIGASTSKFYLVGCGKDSDTAYDYKIHEDLANLTAYYETFTCDPAIELPIG